MAISACKRFTEIRNGIKIKLTFKIRCRRIVDMYITVLNDLEGNCLDFTSFSACLSH